MPDLKERLNKAGIIITDGATGTMLQRAGLAAGAPSESWVLDNPDGVRMLHRIYIQAGSTAILTNTFGGTRIKLEANQLGEKVNEINLTAAKLARQEAGQAIFVIGDIGPTGKIMEPLGTLSYAEAVKVFAEQAQNLSEGGVDAIVIETMSDINEAKAAIEGVRRVTKLPLIVTMSFDTRGRTMMGVKPSLAVREFLAMDVDVVGANCGRTLEETLTALQEMRQIASDAVLWAKPNAGLPHISDGDTVYDVSPDVMAEYALKFAEVGVKFFGGCCGSNPDHIRAVARVLQK